VYETRSADVRHLKQQVLLGAMAFLIDRKQERRGNNADGGGSLKYVISKL
jgi:hypothetical protein